MIELTDDTYCEAPSPVGGYVCTRSPGHTGIHVATTDAIVAEWGQIGADDEQGIRADERRRLADLLDDHAHDIGAFTADTEATVRMVALLLRLKP